MARNGDPVTGVHLECCTSSFRHRPAVLIGLHPGVLGCLPPLVEMEAFIIAPKVHFFVW
jgi:hypothetical protein